MFVGWIRAHSSTCQQVAVDPSRHRNTTSLILGEKPGSFGNKKHFFFSIDLWKPKYNCSVGQTGKAVSVYTPWCMWEVTENVPPQCHYYMHMHVNIHVIFTHTVNTATHLTSKPTTTLLISEHTGISPHKPSHTQSFNILQRSSPWGLFASLPLLVWWGGETPQWADN